MDLKKKMESRFLNQNRPAKFPREYFMRHLVSCLFMFCCLSNGFSTEKLASDDYEGSFHFRLTSNENSIKNSIKEFVARVPIRFEEQADEFDGVHHEIEFLRSGESIESYNELIQLQELISPEAKLHEFMECFVEDYENETPKVDCKLIFEKENNISVGSVLVDAPVFSADVYDPSFKSKCEKVDIKYEIIGVKAVQGERGLVLASYAIKYAKNDLKGREVAREKVLAFLGDCHVQSIQMKNKTLVNEESKDTQERGLAFSNDLIAQPQENETDSFMDESNQRELMDALADIRAKHGFYNGKDK